jgi:hypothetical protein
MCWVVLICTCMTDAWISKHAYCVVRFWMFLICTRMTDALISKHAYCVVWFLDVLVYLWLFLYQTGDLCSLVLDWWTITINWVKLIILPLMQFKRQIACTYICNQPEDKFVQIYFFLITQEVKSKSFGSPPLCSSSCGSEENIVSH